MRLHIDLFFFVYIWNNYMRKIIYILLFILCINALFSQTLKYNVYFFGSEVGNYTAVRTSNNNHTSIKVNGKSDFSFIKEFVMIFSSKSRFTNGHLIYSASKRLLNGEKKDSVVIYKNKNHKYRVFSFVKGVSEVDNIYFTGSMMYFNEPRNFDKIFSENKGYFVPVKKIKEHVFVTEDDDRNEKITYYYKNNILVKAIIEKSLFTLEMKLAN